MPVLPDVQSLGPRPTPASAYRPVSVSGGDAVGDATARLGDTITKEADAQFKRLTLADAQKALTAMQKMQSDLLYNPENGALARRGEQAINVRQEYLDRYDTESQRFMATLSGPTRKAAEADFQASRRAFDQSLSAHQLREQKVYMDSVHEAHIDSAQNGLGQAYVNNDQGQINYYGSVLRDAYTAKALADGTPDAAAQAIREAEGKALVGAANLAAQNWDTDAAFRVLAKAGDLAPMQQAQVRSVLDPIVQDAVYKRVMDGTSPTVQSFPPAVQSVARNTDDEYLRTVAVLESGGNPNAVNPTTGAFGTYQYMPDLYPEMRDATPEQQRAKALEIRETNRLLLRKALMREPTDAELYLAHMQGGDGAKRLLLNPDAKAVLARRSRDAIVLNGGTEDMTAREFVAKWATRYESERARLGGAPPPAAQAPGLPAADIRALSPAQLEEHLTGLGLRPDYVRAFVSRAKTEQSQDAAQQEAQIKASRSAVFAMSMELGVSPRELATRPEAREVMSQYRLLDPENYQKLMQEPPKESDPRAYLNVQNMVVSGATGADILSSPDFANLKSEHQIQFLSQFGIDGKANQSAAHIQAFLKDNLIERVLGVNVEKNDSPATAQEKLEVRTRATAELSAYYAAEQKAGRTPTFDDLQRFVIARMSNVWTTKISWTGRAKTGVARDTPGADVMPIEILNHGTWVRLTQDQLNMMSIATLIERGTDPTPEAIDALKNDAFGNGLIREAAGQ